jgi:hypothetical protein
MAATDTHATIEELLDAVFSVRSVSKLYKWGQLPIEDSLETAVRSVAVWCDMAASRGVSEWSGVSWLMCE